MISAKKSSARTSLSFQSASASTTIAPATSVATAARRAVSLHGRASVPTDRASATTNRPYTNTRSRGTMALSMAADELVVHGAREHNLKDITVRLPRNALICITGLSGSGKSSLAFDTIYAEGQRRYVESLSRVRAPVPADDGEARRRLDRRASARRSRSTRRRRRATRARPSARSPRSTTTCACSTRASGGRTARSAGGRSPGQSIDSIVEQILALPEGTRFTVNAPVVRDRKGEYRDLFEELRNEGFTRVKVDGEQHLLEEPPALDKKFKHTIEVVVDRLVMKEDLRTRLTQSVETAIALAEGLVVDRPRRRRRDAAPTREQLRVPRARRLAARAAAAHLLVQLAARRVPALHRPRRAAGDRPRPARARPGALDRRRRARPVGGRQLELLRVGDPGDRRALRDRLDRPWQELTEQQQDYFLYGTERRQGLRQLPQPDGPPALVHARRSRGSSPRSQRRYRETDSSTQRERIEEYMSFRPVPGLQGRAAQARGARGHGRRAATSTSSRSCRSRARSRSSTRST